MTMLRTALLIAVLCCAVLSASAKADVFNRISTFHVVDNLPANADPATATVSEIIAATEDGMTLVYTDSPGRRIGLVDIADPAAPKAAGTVALNGEPTSVVHYALDKAEKGWTGLSEITAVGDGLVIVERDNQVGRDAAVKQLTYVPLAGLEPVPPGSTSIPVVTKTVIRDLLPDLGAPSGFVLDKVESFSVDAAGDAYIVTDNDGVDDHSGETQFVRLGKLALPM